MCANVCAAKCIPLAAHDTFVSCLRIKTVFYIGQNRRKTSISDDPKGPCHVELLALPDPIPMGAFVPQCEDDGYYQPAQFHASTGQSWCVTREGEEIDGTRSLPGQPITDCNRGRTAILISFR